MLIGWAADTHFTPIRAPIINASSVLIIFTRRHERHRPKRRARSATFGTRVYETYVGLPCRIGVLNGLTPGIRHECHELPRTI